jgi:hypothetical protein
MDNSKTATIAMMMLSVLVLSLGTLSIGGAASVNLFEQTLEDPVSGFGSYKDSDSSLDYLVYDNFWGVTGDICDIHWYGGGFDNCNPEGMIFDITFYANNATGMPGAVVCSYENVSPKISYHGYYPPYFGNVSYFETDLNPCCQLRDGWVSIQSQGNATDCRFMWSTSSDGDGTILQEDRISNSLYEYIDDLAFTLTGKAEVPALTPIGLVALVGLLSALAVLTMRRKRR